MRRSDCPRDRESSYSMLSFQNCKVSCFDDSIQHTVRVKKKRRKVALNFSSSLVFTREFYFYLVELSKYFVGICNRSTIEAAKSSGDGLQI